MSEFKTNIKIDEKSLTPHQDAINASLVGMKSAIGGRKELYARITVGAMDAIMPLVAEALDDKVHGKPTHKTNKAKSEIMEAAGIGIANVIVSAVSTVNGRPSMAQVLNFMQHLTGQVLFITSKQVDGSLELGGDMQVAEIKDTPHGQA